MAVRMRVALPGSGTADVEIVPISVHGTDSSPPVSGGWSTWLVSVKLKACPSMLKEITGACEIGNSLKSIF
jgi:hypothetical protein